MEYWKMSARISIVMATYERFDMLKMSVQSVLDQTMKDWELVVVDDHSSHNPDAFILSLEDERIHFHRQPENVGISQNVATGMKLATAPLITNLHDDDLLDANFLEIMVAAAEDRPDAAVTFCEHRVVNSDNSLNMFQTLKRSTMEGRASLHAGDIQPFWREAVLSGTVFLGLGAVWKRGAINWDDVAAMGDHWDSYALYLLAGAGGPAVYLPNELASWRYHGDSNTLKIADPADPMVKLRSGVSTVRCNLRYLQDAKLAAWHKQIRQQLADGWASIAVAELRMNSITDARYSSRRSLAVKVTLRAVVCHLVSYAPVALRRRVVAMRRGN